MTTTMASVERMTLTASLTLEEGGYVARCLELPVVSEGDSVDEALEMLREAVELYLEDQPSPVALPVVRKHHHGCVSARTPRDHRFVPRFGPRPKPGG